jgi:hypothetical protein
MQPEQPARKYRGSSGKVEVPGLGAVPAIFSSWTLLPQEGGAATRPTWSLRAVMSYQNDSMLTNGDLPVAFICQLSRSKVLVLCGHKSLQLQGSTLLVEGLIPCRPEVTESLSGG